MWSHDVISTSIGLAGDLKMGQYLKIPPRAMFLTQLWGTILGAAINYGMYHHYRLWLPPSWISALVVMVSVVDAQREILLDPIGTNVWVSHAEFNVIVWNLYGNAFHSLVKFLRAWTAQLWHGRLPSNFTVPTAHTLSFPYHYWLALYPRLFNGSFVRFVPFRHAKSGYVEF